MDDHVIDLSEYLERHPRSDAGEKSSFAVWGGEGERSRFALPLWRAIYLVGGDRGGLVRARKGASPPEKLTPFFVLDLASEPPRKEFSPGAVEEVWSLEPPAVADRGPGGVAVLLGEEGAWKWFLVVDDGSESREPLGGDVRDDLLFLAGECAGLLFHRELSHRESEGE